MVIQAIIEYKVNHVEECEWQWKNLSCSYLNEISLSHLTSRTDKIHGHARMKLIGGYQYHLFWSVYLGIKKYLIKL